MKVIVVTIAACQKMKELEKFKELAETLTEIFDQIGRSNNKDVILSLNIHANRSKIPMSNADRVNEKVWQRWRFDDDANYDTNNSRNMSANTFISERSYHSEIAQQVVNTFGDDGKSRGPINDLYRIKERQQKLIKGSRVCRLILRLVILVCSFFIFRSVN